MASPADLRKMAAKLRRLSIVSTTTAGSGHPTTCMSCAEIMSTIFFSELNFDPTDPSAHDVDIFVLSKGHAAPILWAALHEAGAIAVPPPFPFSPDPPLQEDVNNLRKFDSVLEGHPTFRSPWVRVATGSLGQGLTTTLGMAIARKIDAAPGRFFCLLGDGESAEGSVWEAAALAGYRGVDNLVAVVDVNRLGQSQPTMYEHDTAVFARRFASFGWHVLEVDGHDVDALLAAFASARATEGKPTAILARTFKGQGVSFLKDKDNWHGKPVPKATPPPAA